MKKDLAFNIKKIREDLNLSQNELAQRIGKNQAYISLLEQGKSNITIDTLQKISQALGVHVSVLVQKTELENNITSYPFIHGLVNNSKLDEVLDWYHQRFDGTPYLMHMIGESECSGNNKIDAILNSTHKICVFDTKGADWFLDINDNKRISKYFLDRYKTKKQIDAFIELWDNRENTFKYACQKIEETNLSLLSDNELIKLHRYFVDAVIEKQSSSSVIDAVALSTDKKLHDMLKQVFMESNLVDQYSFTDFFATITYPEKPSYTFNADLDLHKLARDIRNNPETRTEKLQKYANSYFWIKNNYRDVYRLTSQYFEEQLLPILHSEKDLDELIESMEREEEERQKKKEELIKKITLNKETEQLLYVTQKFTTWQDERKLATLFTAHYGYEILKEFSKRSKIPTPLLMFMSPREVDEILDNVPSIAQLEERKNGCCVLWTNTGYEIVTGKDYKKVQSILYSNESHDNIDDFRGMVASQGVAIGNVRVITSVKDIGTMKEGEILVTVMTRPDYVPAMKKAAAIITDEGGITSHAAIVARELNIPCVIGTKIATKVLKDGDRVEVRAHHGLIKILKDSQDIKH